VRTMADASLRAMVKGAPDILLERSTHILAAEGVRPITDDDRRRVTDTIAGMALGALRVLAAGYRTAERRELEDPQADTLERDLVFVGLVGMYDPPRPEAKAAVAECHRAGIRVVMITGDHPHTALAVARELGIASGQEAAISGSELDVMSDEELRKKVSEVAVYARVTAEHKLRIVRAWRAQGGIVAMTGDGVNDAPAIKGADIGIAMGRSGTEVTKEASDMVVTDDNFASIVAAVEEGRGVYDNIRKTLLYLLAGNFGELLLMAAALVAGLPVPLLAIHLLWINLVTDGLPALALATDPIDPDVMNRPPRSGKATFTDRNFFGMMVFTGILDASVAMGAYLYGLRYDNLEMARTFAFAALVYVEILRSFSYRSETKPIWEVGFFSNLKLGLVAVAAIAFQPWSHHMQFLGTFLKSSPVPWSECLALLAVGAIPLLVLETLKVVRRRRAGSLRAASAGA
jgi:Ca2+-transporting ATPase